MTVLKRYALLEAGGRYFDGRSSRPQDVIIAFRERSLIIKDLDDAIIAHWPLASLRARGGRGEHPVHIVPYADSDERLTVEDDTMIEAITAVCPSLYHREVDRKGLKRAAVWGIGAIGAVVLMVFVLVPALAERLAVMIPPEREQALGDTLVDQLGSLLARNEDGTVRFCEGAEGRAALSRMTGRLAGQVDLPYPLRVEVLDHEMINALALPGGRIIVFRGLIDAASGPEEVAGVLAHEIGHVINRDPTVATLRAAGTAGILGLLIGDIFGAGAIAAASDAALNASYQREAETRADDEAVKILAAAGLPSTPFAGFFERLRERHGDTPLVLRYFASHPELAARAERAAAADSVGNGSFTPVLNDRDWIALQGVCAERD
jgi:Zn-dependent protease with chaperone function